MHLHGILFAMKQKLSTLQVQKHILAPLMQKSISILLLPVHELQSAIEQEIQENPLLELDVPDPHLISLKRDADLNVKISQLRDINDRSFYDNTLDNEEITQRPVAGHLSLTDYLMEQLSMETSDPKILTIGEQIIGNIDDNGYLTQNCENIARDLQISDVTLVEQVLSLIQTFDPLGIAARNIRECLLIQLNFHLNGQGDTIRKVIEHHFEELGRKRHDQIARNLKVSVDDIKEIARYISTLEPKPARSFHPIDSGIYVKPDVFVHEIENGYSVRVNSRGVPPLRISSFYREMLNRPNLSREEKTFIAERLEKAINFINSIKQREETMKEIALFIVERQQDFFKMGSEGLVPLGLKDVARVIDRDESTVSRAIRNKYIDTPQGVYPLKYFFSGSLVTAENGNVSTQRIKEQIKELIENEDRTSPLSDEDIRTHFREKGIQLSRRTVAKYRQLSRIPPSFLRKN